MSGKISAKPPFELPTEDGSQTEECSVVQLHVHEGQQEDISSENLKSMEQVYLREVPKFQSLLTIYEMEKKKARKQEKLRRFPKTFACWRPEGSQSDEETASILGGLQPTTKKYKEYFLEAKQHSHSYHYISKEHPTQRPSTVYYLDSSSKAGTTSKNPRFGVIHCIYQHSFAQRTFLWAAVSLYEDCWYDSTSGLWCSKDSVGQTVPVLIRYLSHPLTVAADGNLKIWFLDVFI